MNFLAYLSYIEGRIKLKKDKIKVLFRNRAPVKDELGYQYPNPQGYLLLGSSISLGFGSKGCPTAYGIQVDQIKGSLTSSPGQRIGDRFVMRVTAFVHTKRRAFQLGVPFNKDWAVANVMLHESLFHVIAGYYDHWFITHKANIDTPGLNPFLINGPANLPEYLANEVREELDIE